MKALQRFLRFLPPRAVLAACLLSLPGSVLAQRVVLKDASLTPVSVETATIASEITGTIAVTTFDLVVRNPNARALEGMFEFPLLDGQQVVRFALDLDGKLREAVPVEKERGREIFEDIERRRVDPALLEQTAGNNYRARIFPLPANGTRRIVIAYQENLARSAAGIAGYRLALDFPAPLQRFALTLTTHFGTRTPATVRSTLALGALSWSPAQTLEFMHEQFTARGQIEIDVPSDAAIATHTEQFRDREYFCAEVPVRGLKEGEREKPRVLGLVWDASRSGKARDHSREFALLDAWFRAVPDVEVRVQLLRDQAESLDAFVVRGGNWSRLRAKLEDVVYDGGTSFDGLGDDPQVDEWMLFTDGLVNFGVANSPNALAKDAPLHVVNSSLRADPARMKGWAETSGGVFVDLLGIGADVAVARLRSPSLRVLEITQADGSVADVLPGAGTCVTSDALLVTGVLKQKSATLRVRVGHSKRDARVFEVRVRSRENPGHLAARAWAAARIAGLSHDTAKNHAELTRVGQEFRIVTPGTSLIVLETLEDYVRYNVTPPDELRAAWDERKKADPEAREVEEIRARQLESVAEMLAEKREWWSRKYTGTWKKAEESAVSPVPASPPPPTNAAAPSASPATLSTPAAPVPADAPAPAPQTSPAGTPAEGEDVIRLDSFVVQSARRGNAYSINEQRLSANLRTTVAADAFGDVSEGNTGEFLRYLPGTDVERDDAAPSSIRGHAPVPEIELVPWKPDAEYLQLLRAAKPAERYAAYLKEHDAHANEPGFYFDAADVFFAQKQPALAVRILSNLAELELENAELSRILAHRLAQVGRPELARPLFERVLELRGREPQSWRDLALVCAALHDEQRAVDLLWHVVETDHHNRFPEIELIALGELNAIVATCGKKLDLSRMDARFLDNMPVDLRVVLTWSSDNSDLDLWVEDPDGEMADYSHARTEMGGRVSKDFTGGYGPEEFLLRRARPGKYIVRANFYGDERQDAFGPITAQLTLFTDFGTPKQKERVITVRLETKAKELEIGSIVIGGGRAAHSKSSASAGTD